MEPHDRSAAFPSADAPQAAELVTAAEDGVTTESADAFTASSWGTACRVACWAAAGMGCATASTACTGSTVITVGGTSIPCAWAVIAACGAVGGGAQYCAERLCPP